MWLSCTASSVSNSDSRTGLEDQRARFCGAVDQRCLLCGLAVAPVDRRRRPDARGGTARSARAGTRQHGLRAGNRDVAAAHARQTGPQSFATLPLQYQRVASARAGSDLARPWTAGYRPCFGAAARRSARPAPAPWPGIRRLSAVEVMANASAALRMEPARTTGASDASQRHQGRRTRVSTAATFAAARCITSRKTRIARTCAQRDSSQRPRSGAAVPKFWAVQLRQVPLHASETLATQFSKSTTAVAAAKRALPAPAVWSPAKASRHWRWNASSSRERA